MSDKAAALADTSHLTPFEGLPVTGVGIEIPGAAGGLRDAMAVEPREFHRDDEVFVVLRCTVAKVRFDPAKSDETEWRRVHIFDAEQAVIVDGDLVAEHLAAQAERIQRAKDEAAGVLRLELDGDEDTATVLSRQHHAGVHTDGLREGCPECLSEMTAVSDEAMRDGAKPSTGRQRMALTSLIGALTETEQTAYVGWCGEYGIPVAPVEMTRDQAQRVATHLAARDESTA
jgi:hypothetical protein